MQQPAGLHRVRTEQAERGVAVRRRLDVERTALRTRGQDLASNLPRVAVVLQAADDAHGRDAGQRIAGIAQRPAHRVETEFEVKPRAEVDVGVRFHTLQPRVATHELDERQVLVVPVPMPIIVMIVVVVVIVTTAEPRLVCLFTERAAEDVVVDRVVEVRDLGRHALETHTIGDVEAVRDLRSEIVVADLEREVAGVQAVEVELFERRIARGARETHRQRAPFGGAHQRPD